jgi:hypothetical protein
MNASESIIAILSILSLALLTSAVAPVIVADDAGAGERTIEPMAATIRETNLRKAPTKDSEILMLIPKETTVAVGVCRSGWCRVSWNGKGGYAIARNIDVAPQWPLAVPWQGDIQGQWQKARNIDVASKGEESSADHSLILEIGSAGEWPIGEHPNFGGTIAAEIEPIENWLELEFGLSTLATTGHTELSGDLLFKKPFHLSPTVEFMVGAGPSFSRTLNGPEQGNAWSMEFALDWMFWPPKI